MEWTSNLGNDVILHIFSFLPVPLIANVRQVCKNWNKICDSETIWEKICKEFFGVHFKCKETWKEQLHFITTVTSKFFSDLRIHRRNF